MPEQPTIQEYIESVAEAKVKAATVGLTTRIIELEQEIATLRSDLIALDNRVTNLE